MQVYTVDYWRNMLLSLYLCDGIIDIDGRDFEISSLHHIVEVVYTSRRLLGQSLDVLKELGVLLVHQVGQVTAIVQDKVEGTVVGEHQGLKSNST